MRLVWAAIIAACTISTGCAPVKTETAFMAEREALVGSPALFRKAVDECVAKVRLNVKLVENLATLMNVEQDRAPPIVCERFTKAMRDGRYTYAQYLEATKGNLTPELVRIAQGR